MDISDLAADLKRVSTALRPTHTAHIAHKLPPRQSVISTASVPPTSPQPVNIANILSTCTTDGTGLTVVHDEKGPVHDNVSVVAKCSRGHVHKYFLSDIIKSSALPACTTCSHGNKNVRRIREQLEEITTIAFALQNHVRGQASVFENPVYGIKLIILSSATATSPPANAEVATIIVCAKQSAKITRLAFITALTPHLAGLPLLAQAGIERATITAMKSDERRSYFKAPLVYTPELAAAFFLSADPVLVIPISTTKQLYFDGACPESSPVKKYAK